MKLSSRVFSSVLLFAIGCSGDDAGQGTGPATATGTETSGPEGRGTDTTEPDPSTGGGTTGGDAPQSEGSTSETSVSGTETGQTGTGQTETGDDSEGLPEGPCDPWSVSAAGSLNGAATNQLNPGRALGFTADARAVALSHYYDGDQSVVASVFDPSELIESEAGPPVTLRSVGPWNGLAHTELHALPTQGGAVVLEDANGQVFAHRLDDDQWVQDELEGIPGGNYILDVEQGTDERVGVLVASEVGSVRALYLAFYEPEQGGWSARPRLFSEDPSLDLAEADLALDNDDGDVLVGFTHRLANGNWPRRGEAHHFDAQSGQWTQVFEEEGFVFSVQVRELDPGEHLVAPYLFGDEEQRAYLLDASDTLSEAIPMEFPDVYVDGTFRRATFYSDQFRYQSYSIDDPAGTHDNLVPSEPVYWEGAQIVAAGTRAYAAYVHIDEPHVAYARIRDERGWGDPVVVFTSENPIYQQAQIDVSLSGDAVFSFTASCNNFACPTSAVAVYSPEQDCWKTDIELDPAILPIAYPLPSDLGFVITSIGSDYLGRLLSPM